MRIDWQTLVRNLRSIRAMRSVSRRCGMCDDWLCQFARKGNYEPTFHAGMKLLRAHLELCGKEKHREVVKR